MGPEGTEPVVDLADMAEVIRLAFPGTTVVSSAEVSGRPRHE
jgi:hypothetical protein